MSVPLSDSWRKWLTYNINHGGDKHKLLDLAIQQGLDKDEVMDIVTRRVTKPLKGIGEQEGMSFLEWSNPPFIHDTPKIAWKVDTDLAQMYEIPNFMKEDECKIIINEINSQLVESSLTTEHSNYRTSRTCYLNLHNKVLSKNIDEKICELFGMTYHFSEGLQGVRYDPGQYFKGHTDYFDPGTPQFDENVEPGGQRTWTFMIYLNEPIRGGHTFFERIGRSFAPVTGTALLWNNLYPDGTVNPFTYHEALPVEEGNKWIITKWLRFKTGRNNYD